MRFNAVFSRGLLSIMIISVLLSISVNAGLNRDIEVSPRLRFSDGIASCKVSIAADSSSDWISATMELWRGNTMLNNWSTSGAESISMDETENVTRYHTYRLVINYKVNGVAQSPVEISKYYG